jgi:hypothetical protein
MRQIWQVALLLAGALALSAAPSLSSQLLLREPPVLAKGRWYAPVRPLAAWLGATVDWQPRARRVVVTWQAKRGEWSLASGPLLLRRGQALVPIMSFGQAFGLNPHPIRGGKAIALGPGTFPEAIPVGWQWPRPPQGLSGEKLAVWRNVVGRRGDPGNTIVVRPYDLRISERWATAWMHPLNSTVTDDAMVVLEKRHGRWEALTSGGAIDVEPKWGMPKRVQQRLGLPLNTGQ